MNIANWYQRACRKTKVITTDPTPMLIVVVCFWSLGLAMQVVNHRCLSADGVNFLLRILVSGWFHTWDYPRQFAHNVTQWPVVLAVRLLHVHNLPALSMLYGVGLYSLGFLCLLGSFFVVPKAQRGVLLWVVAVWTYLTLNTSMFVISESQVATALFIFLWLFVMFCLPHKPQAWQCVMACAAAFLSVRSYEFFAILGPLLALATFFQYRRFLHVQGFGLGGHFTCLFLMGCGVVASVISVDAMFFSARSLKQVGLFEVLQRLLVDRTVWLSSSLLLIFFGCACFGFAKPLAAKSFLWLQIFLALIAGILCGLLASFDEAFFASPALHYDARILHLLTCVGFALAVFWVKKRQQPTCFAIRTTSLLPLICLLSYNLSWESVVSQAWRRYTLQVQTVVQVNQGLVPLESLPVASNRFAWSWSMPSLSIVLAGFAGNTVSSMILPLKTCTWQPFDPHDAQTWPDLHVYGLHYALHP